MPLSSLLNQNIEHIILISILKIISDLDRKHLYFLFFTLPCTNCQFFTMDTKTVVSIALVIFMCQVTFVVKKSSTRRAILGIIITCFLYIEQIGFRM